MSFKSEAVWRKVLDHDKIVGKLEGDVRRALLRGAHRVERSAKHRVPVRTGILRGSIQVYEQGRLSFLVGTRKLLYALFVEFGTGRRGASSKLLPTAREGMLRQGYVHGPKQGMVARPFLFPAWEENRGKIVEEVAETARRSLGS